MMEVTRRRTPGSLTALRVLTTVDAATLLLGAVLHRGVQVPLGFVTLAEPTILPATIVESACGLGLAVAAYGLFTRASWAWVAAVAAHGLAIAGVLLGVVALAAGRGPSTELNTVYHRVLLLALMTGLALLFAPATRAALGRGKGQGPDGPLDAS
jgi:hypothetical protein